MPHTAEMLPGQFIALRRSVQASQPGPAAGPKTRPEGSKPGRAGFHPFYGLVLTCFMGQAPGYIIWALRCYI